MDQIDDVKTKMLIHKIGLKHHLQDAIITKIVNSPYKFTREVITNLDVNNIETEEEFNKLKTNFIYLYLGKLHTNFSILKKHKLQSENLIKYHKLKQQENE